MAKSQARGAQTAPVATVPAAPVAPVAPAAVAPAAPTAPVAPPAPVAVPTWYSYPGGPVQQQPFPEATLVMLPGTTAWVPFTQGKPAKAPKAAKPAPQERPKVPFDGKALYANLAQYEDRGSILKVTTGKNRAVTAFCADGTVVTVILAK